MTVMPEFTSGIAGFGESWGTLAPGGAPVGTDEAEKRFRALMESLPEGKLDAA